MQAWLKSRRFHLHSAVLLLLCIAFMYAAVSVYSNYNPTASTAIALQRRSGRSSEQQSGARVSMRAFLRPDNPHGSINTSPSNITTSAASRTANTNSAAAVIATVSTGIATNNRAANSAAAGRSEQPAWHRPHRDLPAFQVLGRSNSSYVVAGGFYRLNINYSTPTVKDLVQYGPRQADQQDCHQLARDTEEPYTSFYHPRQGLVFF